MSEPDSHQSMVPADAPRQRLDRYLADTLPALSRSRIKALILAGHASVDGTAANDPARMLRGGQRVGLSVPAAAPAEPLAQAIPLDVVYEDEALIVIDKPAGLVVHPAAGNPDRTLVNALLAHCGDSLSGIGGVRRPGIVHRLDKETSGLMLAAKTDQAHQALAAQFAAHSIARAYAAVVWGTPKRRQGTVSGNIGRDPRNRKRMTVVAKGGKPARTGYCVRQRLGSGLASLLRCRLETGRTHQIRVHMRAIGCPLIGDPVYGRGQKAAPKGAPEAAIAFSRQALHAYFLGFTHPLSLRPLYFHSNFPNDIKCLLESFGKQEEKP
ncbi:MAG: RluA family pseudouridine synthase [Alphaproteobacteria bacterium]|jgi:23S rRNA pseudouridine1911/1915/1917 synthase|nr:RluA family pseudouridine synthase [Alphaproteobacteria bacterium]